HPKLGNLQEVSRVSVHIYNCQAHALPLTSKDLCASISRSIFDGCIFPASMAAAIDDDQFNSLYMRYSGVTPSKRRAMVHSAPDDPPKEAPMPVAHKLHPDMPENPQPKDCLTSAPMEPNSAI
uniref:hypothetical protein n=1 Tax=uncultured Sulfitobacter sp. TaxID=191468 RepID=UPI0030D6EA69